MLLVASGPLVEEGLQPDYLMGHKPAIPEKLTVICSVFCWALHNLSLDRFYEIRCLANLFMFYARWKTLQLFQILFQQMEILIILYSISDHLKTQGSIWLAFRAGVYQLTITVIILKRVSIPWFLRPPGTIFRKVIIPSIESVI
jgi:hypothetical protein